MLQLSPKATAIAAGLVWGGAILIVGLINLADPSYGMSFIQMRRPYRQDDCNQGRKRLTPGPVSLQGCHHAGGKSVNNKDSRLDL